MPSEIELTQPDGSSEAPDLDELEAKNAAEADTPEPDEATDDETAEANEPDEVTVSISGEPDPEPEPERAPDWVRDLRRSHRELQRKVREYEAREQTAPVQAEIPRLGAKPKLEEHDYDTERYEKALEDWYKKRDAVDAVKREQQRQADEQAKSWQAKLDGYGKAKAELKVRDYDDAEAAVQEALSVTQQGVVLQGAENPALVVYALGKNPKKAKELAAINDPVKFAFAIAKLESQLKIQPRKTAPPPERTAPSGNAPISGATDGHLERLRSEAMRTGDMTKVIRYKQQQREKQSAKR
jgi:hypothetical protein